MSEVSVKVIYFGQAREFAGTKEDQLRLRSPADLGRLISEVVGAHPDLAKVIRMNQPLVNGRIVPEDTELRDGDRVAFLPPVAGG